MVSHCLSLSLLESKLFKGLQIRLGCPVDLRLIHLWWNLPWTNEVDTFMLYAIRWRSCILMKKGNFETGTWEAQIVYFNISSIITIEFKYSYDSLCVCSEQSTQSTSMIKYWYSAIFIVVSCLWFWYVLRIVGCHFPSQEEWVSFSFVISVFTTLNTVFFSSKFINFV